MAENNLQYRHGVEVMSRPPFTYAGDIYLEQDEFMHKLKKDAVTWYEFPFLSMSEAWFLFREKGDLQKTFGVEWKAFVERANKMVEDIHKQATMGKPKEPQYYG